VRAPHCGYLLPAADSVILAVNMGSMVPGRHTHFMRHAYCVNFTHRDDQGLTRLQLEGFCRFMASGLAYSETHTSFAISSLEGKACQPLVTRCEFYFPPPQRVRRGADAERYGLQGMIIIIITVWIRAVPVVLRKLPQ
jgi:hypothetical protein